MLAVKPVRYIVEAAYAAMLAAGPVYTMGHILTLFLLGCHLESVTLLNVYRNVALK